MTRVVRKSPSSGLKTGVHSSLCYNLYGKITLWFNPEEVDFLTTRIKCPLIIIGQTDATDMLPACYVLDKHVQQPHSSDAS